MARAGKAEKDAAKAAEAKEAARAAAKSPADEMRELGAEELASRLAEAKEELFNLRFQMATGQMDNNRRVRTVRRSIARIYTIVRERELGLSVGPDELDGKEGAA